MPNWTAITTANLANAKVSALVDALRTAALGVGQTDRSTEIITNVVNRIRVEVQACRTNIIDSDATKIPKELLALALRLVLWDLKNALEITPTDGEKIDHTNDENFLKRIASCEIPISIADNPITAPVVQPTSASPKFGTRTRNFTDASQDGSVATFVLICICAAIAIGVLYLALLGGAR
jgi:hypothetical protein